MTGFLDQFRNRSRRRSFEASDGKFTAVVPLEEAGQIAVHVQVESQAPPLTPLHFRSSRTDWAYYVFGVETMEQRMSERFARPQFYREAVMFFATFAFNSAS